VRIRVERERRARTVEGLPDWTRGDERATRRRRKAATEVDMPLAVGSIVRERAQRAARLVFRGARGTGGRGRSCRERWTREMGIVEIW
jgi:hypothetical protein